MLSSPVCGDWVSSVTAAALTVNSVVAVPVSETIASVCLPTDRVSRYFSFQIDNGAAFLYCVVGSIQVFAVYLYLLEVFISCIGSKGKTVLWPFCQLPFAPAVMMTLKIGSNRTADSTFAIVIAVAGGRNVCQILRICVGLAVKFNGCCISGYTCFRAGARGLFCRCYNYFRSFLMGFILFTSKCHGAGFSHPPTSSRPVRHSCAAWLDFEFFIFVQGSLELYRFHLRNASRRFRTSSIPRFHPLCRWHLSLASVPSCHASLSMCKRR